MQLCPKLRIVEGKIHVARNQTVLFDFLRQFRKLRFEPRQTVFTLQNERAESAMHFQPEPFRARSTGYGQRHGGP